MTNLPDTLEDATTQAIAATVAAIEAGFSRLIVDIRFAELKPMPIAYDFALQFNKLYGENWQALFADAGAAALAKHEWADLEVSMRGVNEGRAAIRPEDKAFLLVAPSSVEVDRVEKLLQLAGDRPFVLLNPRLENTEVGIGLTARKLRDRFFNTFETCYYIQPLREGAALWRNYPQAWQVWQPGDEGMKMILEQEQRPVGDDLNRIITQATGKQASFLTQMQQMFKTLIQ
jgi:hypothetical protein